MDHLDDIPPFALPEASQPQHLSGQEMIAERQCASMVLSASSHEAAKLTKSAAGNFFTNGSSHASLPPGLVESVITDGSSSREGDSEVQHGGGSYRLDVSSNSLSSLPTITSAIGSSSYLPNSQHTSWLPEVSTPNLEMGARSQASGTFSQLMRAADGENLPFQHSRMPVVPEKTVMEDSSAPPGALISEAPMAQDERGTTRGWLPNMLSNSPRTGLREPFLDDTVQADEPMFAVSPSEASLDRARRSVKSFLEDDQTFEVLMDMPEPCTMRHIMDIIGNPDLLRMWCNPIQSLVVTSTSDGSGDSSMQRGSSREYEAEWIEATTTALESPPSHVSTIYSAGQAVFDALGFASYGRITMFVERRRGQVGLTIGPFSGGIHAAHTISVREIEGQVRIMNRVRLRRDTEGASVASMFFCGVLESCLLSSCLMPSLKAYMSQVCTSMARLRILVENGELSPESEIIGAS